MKHEASALHFYFYDLDSLAKSGTVTVSNFETPCYILNNINRYNRLNEWFSYNTDISSLRMNNLIF